MAMRTALIPRAMEEMMLPIMIEIWFVWLSGEQVDQDDENTRR
jgi:hypothetical protein